jgi:hypothetical protein
MKLAKELDYVVEKFKQIKNLEDYAATMRELGDFDDFEACLGWACLRETVPQVVILSWFKKYGCRNDHITKLVKKALKIVRRGTRR